jgi:hypothetical protein
LIFFKYFTCGAVCVYPERVEDSANTLTSLKLVDIIPIASIATINSHPSLKMSVDSESTH